MTRCDFKMYEGADEHSSDFGVCLKEYYLSVPDSRPDKDYVLCSAHARFILVEFRNTHTAALIRAEGVPHERA